ncbi:hypothetical protein MPH_03819 [Macrophomina phaseolina MS6]|uniref:Uncharacterized protein n=1 Tax=Macrophomina phaseolina (strain MS6) TaxID=1126212 RepID=K2SQG2_MACPH|nr:hypothetical protein MPH_03819 [Macrophomina phaseolina MS6]
MSAKRAHRTKEACRSDKSQLSDPSTLPQGQNLHRDRSRTAGAMADAQTYIFDTISESSTNAHPILTPTISSNLGFGPDEERQPADERHAMRDAGYEGIPAPILSDSCHAFRNLISVDSSLPSSGRRTPEHTSESPRKLGDVGHKTDDVIDVISAIDSVCRQRAQEAESNTELFVKQLNMPLENCISFLQRLTEASLSEEEVTRAAQRMDIAIDRLNAEAITSPGKFTQAKSSVETLNCLLKEALGNAKDQVSTLERAVEKARIQEYHFAKLSTTMAAQNVHFWKALNQLMSKEKLLARLKLFEEDPNLGTRISRQIQYDVRTVSADVVDKQATVVKAGNEMRERLIQLNAKKIETLRALGSQVTALNELEENMAATKKLIEDYTIVP